MYVTTGFFLIFFLMKNISNTNVTVNIFFKDYKKCSVTFYPISHSDSKTEAENEQSEIKNEFIYGFVYRTSETQSRFVLYKFLNIVWSMSSFISITVVKSEIKSKK